MDTHTHTHTHSYTHIHTHIFIHTERTDKMLSTLETANVHQMWWTFNYWTYLLVQILLKWERTILQFGHCMCCSRRFHLRRFLTFWEKKYQYILKNLNFRSLLFMFVSYSPFKYGFKIVYIIPVLTCIHFQKVLCDDKMCVALIQPHWLTGCKTPSCLITLLWNIPSNTIFAHSVFSTRSVMQSAI